MLQLIQYIEDLLYNHNFVVVPDFGGFVAGYQAARITDNGILYPPQKDISFNVNIKYNDGLLIQTIMQNKMISFEQATEYLNENVKQWRIELYRTKTLTFGNIGIFKLNENGVLAFYPLYANDFLISSFGFSPFYFPTISNSESIHNPLVLQEKNDNVVVFTPKHMPLSETFRYAIAGVAIVLLFVLFPFQLTNIPFDYQAGICGYRFAISDNISKSNDTNTATYHDVLDVQEEKLDNIISPQHLQPSHIYQQKQHYYIVIGSFQTLRMAERFIDELPSRFSNIEIVHSDNRYRITVAQFGNEADGEFYLQNFQINHPRFADAWLLQH